MAVLLDHVPEDEGFVSRLREDLAAAGVRVFVSAEPDGSRFPASSHNLIVPVLSESAVHSRALLDRVGRTVRRCLLVGDTSVLPALAERCEVPGRLGVRAPVDFTGAYLTGLAELIEQVRGVLKETPARRSALDDFSRALSDFIAASGESERFSAHLMSERGWRPALESLIRECDATSSIDHTWRARRSGVEVFFLAGRSGRRPWLLQIKNRRSDNYLTVESVASISTVHSAVRNSWEPSLVCVSLPVLPGRRISKELCALSTDLWRPNEDSLLMFVSWLSSSSADLDNAVVQPLEDARERYGALVDRDFESGLNAEERAEMSRLENVLDSHEKDFYAPVTTELMQRNVELLRRRHAALVDKQFSSGLTEAEDVELREINDALDAAEAEFYGPVKEHLRDVLARLG
jgi:hypothetical protein